MPTPLDSVEEEEKNSSSSSSNSFPRKYNLEYYGSSFSSNTSLDRTLRSPTLHRRNRKNVAAESQADRKKILIVDDNPMVRMLLRTMIEKMGHECHTVNNGMEAIKEAERELYHAIILDMQMPMMGMLTLCFSQLTFKDGCAASKQIKQGQLNKDTHIIILTASIDSGE